MSSGGHGIKPAGVAVALAILSGGEVAAGGSSWVDPTRPETGAGGGGAESGPAPAAALELDSILVGDNRRVAVIGGQPYRVGDPVGSLTVQNIFRDRVVLKGPEGARTLRLTLSSGMKKAPSP